jgi:hypothetical protein
VVSFRFSDGTVKLIYSLFGDVSQHRLAVIDVAGVCVPSSGVMQALVDGTNRLSRNVGSYKCTLCSIPKERRYHLHSGGSLKSLLNSPYLPLQPYRIQDLFGLDTIGCLSLGLSWLLTPAVAQIRNAWICNLRSPIRPEGVLLR